MAKKITQYPASGGNPDVGSLIDISELSAGIYTTKKLTIQQLLDYLTANLNIGATTKLNNNTGATILKGTPVQIGSGVSGIIPNLKKISSSDATNDGKIFIPNGDILNGSSGDCIESGLIQFPSSFATGDKVFWNITTQNFTNVSTLDDQIFIGIIILGSPLSSGKMFVAPRFSPSLVKGTAGQIPLFLGERKVNGNTHFTFVDNNGTEVGFRFSDDANNLTQVGVTYLNVESEGIASNSVLRLANWADNLNKGIVSFRKSRGTKATPSKVLINDLLGSLIFTGQADRSINGGIPFSGGMTTAEIVVRALQNFTRNYDSFDDQTLATGGTQFEIYLQPNNGYTWTGDSTPLNVKVFAVNGDGKVYFKNYNFPIDIGLAGQTLVTDASGNLTWQTLSSGGISGAGSADRVAFWSSASVLSYDANFVRGQYGGNSYIQLLGSMGDVEINRGDGSVTQYSNSNCTTILSSYGTGVQGVLQFRRYRGNKSAPTSFLSGDVVGSLQFQMVECMKVVASESNSTGYGNYVIFSTGVPTTLTQQEVIRLKDDGKLRIGNSYDMPKVDGTPNQLMATNGAGQVSFVNNLSPITQDKWALPNSAQLRGGFYNVGTTTKTQFGADAGTEIGTKTAKTPASGSELSKKISCKIGVSVSAVNGSCGFRGTSTPYFRENGILFSCGFAVSDTGYNASSSMFVGLTYLTTLTFAYTAPQTAGNSLFNSINFVGVGNDGYSASFTGSCTGTTLTVSAITYGTLEVGQSFSSATTGTKIVSQLSGTTGGVGTYQLSISQTITNSTMRAFDMNLCIVCNDGSGNATKLNLGDNFPANRLSGAVNTNNFYVFEMYSGIDANEISWRIRNTGIANSVTEGTITTNLPPLGTALNYNIIRNSMGDSNACSVDVSHLYCSNLS